MLTPKLVATFPNALYAGDVMRFTTAILIALATLSTIAAETPRVTNADMTRFEVYPLGLSDPVAMEAAAKALVGTSGSVILDEKNARLLVSATAAQHSELQELMSKVAVAPQNVRIDVEFVDEASGDDFEAGVNPQGQVVVADGDVHSRIKINPKLKFQQSTSSKSSRQTLMVLSGRKGSLHVGERVPYLEWLMNYGMRHGYIHQQLSWQDVGAKLIVEPRVMGDGEHILVKLTPELSGTVNGSAYHTEFAGVATEVVVRNGDSFQIGGLAKDQDFYSRFLVGVHKGNDTRVVDIRLTPTIVDMTQGGSQ